MIKNLFTKHDHRGMPGMTKEQAIQAAAWFWRSRQFSISFTSPSSLQGAQFYSKLGLRQSINVFVVDEGPNVGIDLNLSAELTDEGAAVGLVGAVILFPVTLAVGAVSYIEYENDAQRLIAEFWSYAAAFPKNPQPPTGPVQPPSWAHGQEAQPTAATAAPAARLCPGCNAPVDPDSKFCKYCGASL
jgi:hypothetical protein